MDLKQLEALGITTEDLINRIVDRACEELLSSTDYDEDGAPAGRTKSRLSKELERRIQAHTDAKIQELAEKHVLPNVTAMLETITLRETNRWGEATGQPVTFIEYLVQRADAYMREDVNYEGKSQVENGSYTWSKSSTRVAYLINKHLHYSIETAMKQALANANSSIAKGLEGAVKAALETATQQLKVAVTTS